MPTGSDARNQASHQRKRRGEAMLRNIILEWYGRQNVTLEDLRTELAFRSEADIDVTMPTLQTYMQNIGAARVKRTINGRTANYYVLLGYVPPESPESVREFYPEEQLESELHRMLVRHVVDVEQMDGARVVLKCDYMMGPRIRFHVNSVQWHEIMMAMADHHTVIVYCRSQDAADIVYERFTAGAHYTE